MPAKRLTVHTNRARSCISRNGVIMNDTKKRAVFERLLHASIRVINYTDFRHSTADVTAKLIVRSKAQLEDYRLQISCKGVYASYV